MPSEFVELAIRTTAPLVRAHGDPIHIGAPDAIGIADVMRPDFGDAVDFAPGVWRCWQVLFSRA